MQRLRITELARRRLREFTEEEKGSSTIEFVLWVPIFILILSLVVDVCFLFLAQSRMYDVAADVNRQLAIRRIDEDTAEDIAEANASFRGVEATADANCSSSTCVLYIEMNSADVAVTGILNFLSSDKLTATVTQLQEGT